MKKEVVESKHLYELCIEIYKICFTKALAFFEKMDNTSVSKKIKDHILYLKPLLEFLKILGSRIIAEK